MKLFSTAYRYLKSSPRSTAAVLFFSTLSSIFEGASLGMIIPLIQSMTNAPGNVLDRVPFLDRLNIQLNAGDQAASVSLIFAAMLLMIIAKNVFVYYSNILIAKIRLGTSRDLGISLVNNLMEYDLKYIDTVKTGHIVTVLNTETGRIGDFMMSVLNLISLAIKLVAYVAVLLLISFKASVVLFALMAIVLLPLEVIMKRLKAIGAELSRAYAEYNFTLTELISGIRVIKGFGMEARAKERFNAAAGNVFKLGYRNNRNIHLLIPLSEVSIFTLIVLCVTVLVSVMKVQIASAFPFIATYLVVLVKALAQLNLMNSVRSSAVSNLAAFSAYEDMRREEGKREIRSGMHSVSRFSDGIELKDVGFSYVTGKQVLRNINAVIPSGRTTAIVGISGVGKSTLVNLILRFYDVDEGVITVDGVDLRDLDLAEWRKKIGLVSQDIFIFNASAFDNIAYGCPAASRDKVLEAAKLSGAHDFIMALPQQYDTILGERGVRLSGGQKQRISIARATMHRPEILIFDEATSSLDTETERSIKHAIDALAKGRTTIAIAHRLSTIVNADNIVVLDNGIVAESGSHAELVKKDGLYKHFYDIQFNVKGICTQEAADHA